jgi:peptide/nickel transport system permease protein
VGIGALSAWRPGSLRARSATIFIFSIVSTPTFVLGGLAIFISENLLTANGIRLFADAYTWVPLHVDPLSWADHLILPWLTLALVNSAVYARLSRSSLSEVLAEDYIRTARAKGVSERRVLFRHALRAAMTPLMTQFGIDLGAVLAGAVVVEVVFGLPGLGLQLITAVQSEDLPTIQGIALFISGVVVTANLIVDLLYGLVDPRVRLGAARG